MSFLIKEDEEFLYLKDYIYGDSDSYSEWICSPDGKQCPDPKWPDYIVEADNYALYEIEVRFRIKKSNGEVFLDGVK